MSTNVESNSKCREDIKYYKTIKCTYCRSILKRQIFEIFASKVSSFYSFDMQIQFYFKEDRSKGKYIYITFCFVLY